MQTFRTAVTVAGPAPVAWNVLRDVVDWPTWTPTITVVEPLDGAELAVGRRFRLQQPKMRPAVWQVSAITPNEGFIWEIVSPGIRVIAGHALEPDGPDRCTATLDIAFSGFLAPLIWMLTASRTRSYVEQEAQALKRRVERDSPREGAPPRG